MRKSKYVVALTEAERAQLRTLIGCGEAPARLLTHARILLKADQGEGGAAWTDAAIAGALEIHPTTVARVRRAYGEAGLAAALERKSAGAGVPAPVGRGGGGASDHHRLHEAARGAGALDAAAPGGGTGPPGGGRDRLVRDGAADLRANALKPWLNEQWAIPEASAEFVWHMEDVLDVYARPYDPTQPVVCLDETSRQVLADTREPLPVAPGQAARHDPEYERHGVVNCFVMGEPLRGWRDVRLSDQRTRIDWAACVKTLVDVHYPQAARIVLVMDQLNTHSPASLYQAFPPAEAKRLADKLEIHYTPKHGSWLNMAEIELSVLARQCLNRRLGDRAAMAREVAAWTAARNAAAATIDWQFTTADARIKLKRLYPVLHA